MDKQKKLKIALPILIAVMAYVWGPVIMGSGKKTDPSGGQGRAGGLSRDKTEGGMDITAMSNAPTRNKARTTYDAWGQNPFMITQPPKAISVEGILWDATDPQVMINGNILGVGSNIATNLIIEIKPTSVILQNDKGEMVELKIGEIKQF